MTPEQIAKGLTITRTVRRNQCVLVLENGERYATEYDHTSVNDWRETPFGLVNFGAVYIGPSRAILEKQDD